MTDVAEQGSEITEVSGRWGVFAVVSEGSVCPVEKDRTDKMFMQFGLFGCVPRVPSGTKIPK